MKELINWPRLIVFWFSRPRFNLKLLPEYWREKRNYWLMVDIGPLSVDLMIWKEWDEWISGRW